MLTACPKVFTRRYDRRLDGARNILCFAGYFRNSESEGAAMPCLALGLGVATVKFDQRLAKCQPQSGAAFFRGIRALNLFEAIEDMLDFRFGNAATLILHCDFSPV